MKLYISFTLFILNFSCANNTQYAQELLSTSQTPSNLFDSLNQYLTIDGSLQYYYPYDRYKKHFIRVELDSPYSVMFDLSNDDKVSFFNDISESNFIRYKNVFFNGNNDSAGQFAIDKVRKHQKYGIYSIAKGKDFLNFQTVFTYSSYDLLKEVSPNYTDSFYRKLKDKYENLYGYCLGYYVFDKNYIAFPYSSPRRLQKINDKLYYYREPIIR